MTVADAGGCRLIYDVSGPIDAPVLLLSHSIGTTAELWSPQVDQLAASFRVIRYDTRGHGRSDVPTGEYTIEQLGCDALAVLDNAGVDRAHICGLSLGGLTAMWLAIHAAGRVGRVILASTAPRIGTPEGWTERIRQVRTAGMAAIADAAMPRWFTDGFQRSAPETVARYRSMLASCSAEGYAGCCAVIRDADLRDGIRRITAPTLVIAGRSDPVTTPEHGRDMCASIPGARMTTLAAAHLANVELPQPFTTEVLAFLAGGGRADG
jgi:3-oxoadipate enol-lactonase